MLQWGSQEAFLLEIAETTGMTPPGLLSKPDLPSRCVPIWNIFTLLHDSRTEGMSGPDPIPISEIKSTLDLLGKEDMEHRMFLTHIVKKLDSVFFEDCKKRQGKRVES